MRLTRSWPLGHTNMINIVSQLGYLDGKAEEILNISGNAPLSVKSESDLREYISNITSADIQINGQIPQEVVVKFSFDTISDEISLDSILNMIKDEYNWSRLYNGNWVIEHVEVIKAISIESQQGEHNGESQSPSHR